MRPRARSNKFGGTIRIATIYSIGLYELQSTIEQFLKKYPEVNLHVEYHQNAAIYEMVSNRVIDFGLVAFPQKKNGVVSEIFVEDQLVLVQSPLQRILKGMNIPLEGLNDVKFIAFSPIRRPARPFTSSCRKEISTRASSRTTITSNWSKAP